MSRGFCLVVFCFFLCCSLTVEAVVPPHIFFQEADEDLFAILSFLGDIKQVYEESLSASVQVNCSVAFDGNVSFFYSAVAEDVAVGGVGVFEKQLLFSGDVLVGMKDKVWSYVYLRDFLGPMKNLGVNVSRVVLCHQLMRQNLSVVVEAVRDGGRVTEGLYAVANVSGLLVDARRGLSGIEVNCGEMDAYFSMEVIRGLVSDFSVLFDRYESYVSLLMGYLRGAEPLLIFTVEDTDIVLGEELSGFGYFFGESAFVEGQSITVMWRDAMVFSAVTDTHGRYEVVIPVALGDPVGVFHVSASTQYNQTVYRSPVVAVRVGKIPTVLVLQSSQVHRYVDESIRFSGRLSDYQGVGIQDTISLDIAGQTFFVLTDDAGMYFYDFNETLSFGGYTAVARFSETEIYRPSQSAVLDFYVDTPTVLTLVSNGIHFSVGDRVFLYGWLRNNIDDTPLASKTVALFSNNLLLASCTTNTSGFYNFTYHTSGLTPGGYQVQARFLSDDVMWRSASSDVVSLTLDIGFSEWVEEFPVAIVAGVLVGVVVFFFIVFRKKIIPARKGELLHFIEDATVPVQPVLPAQMTDVEVDRGEFLIDTSAVKRGDIRDAVITRYHTLLRLLSSLGVIFQPSFTHLEIQRLLLREGFSKNASGVVTELFERAMYSPYPLTDGDVNSFNENMGFLLNRVGG